MEPVGREVLVRLLQCLSQEDLRLLRLSLIEQSLGMLQCGVLRACHPEKRPADDYRGGTSTLRIASDLNSPPA